MSTGTETAPARSHWTIKHTAGCILIVVMLGLVALLRAPILVSWLIFLLLLGSFMAIAADGINNRRLGALIDERNRISLSRLQMAAWTLLILSAFMAAAIGNVHAGAPNPLDIVIPQEVWMLMGITTTSLVGSPL